MTNYVTMGRAATAKLMTDQPPSDKALSIYDLLKARAEENPEAIAIAAPGRVPLTYHCLLSQVEYAVRRLNEIGLGRHDRIAVVLPNGPEMAVAFLAIAASAVSVPLNPACRANEFENYLWDLGARALLVQAGLDSPAIDVAKSRGIPVISLAPQSEAGAGAFTLASGPCSRSAQEGFATAQDLALVLSTSGTTSRPKVVPLTHANICGSAHNIRLALELSPADRCVNVMPLFHIHGLIGALLSSLAAGASVLCTQGFHARRFFEWLEEYRPTWYTAVPTLHQAILARAAMNRKTLARCPLRFVRSCSAPLAPRVMSELEEEFHAPVIEAYGMTEAAHQIASNPLPPRRRKPGSVGLATGVQVAIMDPAGNVLPPGQTGEIVVRGASVTPGYENNAEANQDGWCGGWFRTGDQGYLDSESYLFLTGRLKEMIIRGGAKIAPREVEETLLVHPAVAQAVAFAIPHAKLGQDVAAAVVLRQDAFTTRMEIREFVAQRLAVFKVPSRVLIMKEIPKGPTGKLQRIGLAEKLGLVPSGEEPGGRKAGFVAPRTPLEKALAEMWAQVLGLQNIGVHDDFFQLGGDSILATKLYSRVCQAMQVQLSLIRFLEIPTVAGQAWAIANSQHEVPSPALVPIQPAGSGLPFFCVPAETDVMGLLELGHFLGPDQPFYALHPGDLAKGRVLYTAKNAAAHYLKEIRSLQPEGPYLVGGNCAGSSVALELARQLMAQGQQVALLALIDPVLHGYFYRTVRSYWQSLSPFSPIEKLSRVFGTLRGLMGNIRQEICHRVLLMKSRIRLSAGRALPFVPPDVGEANRRALRIYAQQAYPGRVTLFLASGLLSGLRPSLDPKVLWRKLAKGGLDLHVISCDHNSILGFPHVKDLAEQLRACLDNAVKAASDKQSGVIAV
jgi:acyl-CoA synthetase (AMP-forming)/AMP-acid ligase II/thioesterase domain-containing protein